MIIPKERMELYPTPADDWASFDEYGLRKMIPGDPDPIPIRWADIGPPIGMTAFTDYTRVKPRITN